jgi:hypothetical protein
MSKRDEQLRATARRFSDAHEASHVQAPESAPTVRTQRVRRTVDLSPVDHRRLSQWCEDVAEELGLARVTSQDVFVFLVTELFADESLAAAIRDRVKVAAGDAERSRGRRSFQRKNND